MEHPETYHAREAERLLEHPLVQGALADWDGQATQALLTANNLQAQEGREVVLDATYRLQVSQAFVNHLRLYALNLDEAEEQQPEAPA